MARNPDPKKWQSNWQQRPHNFNPNTMGKDKKKAGLAYWNKKLAPKSPYTPEQQKALSDLSKQMGGTGEAPPAKQLTWKEIKASEGYKKGEFNKFYANRPKNLREARDRFQARQALSKKYGGGEDGKLMSWKDIKAQKGYKAGAFQRKLKKMRRNSDTFYVRRKPTATETPDEQQS